MILGIVGSRRRDSSFVRDTLRNAILSCNPVEIVSGGCKKGADRLAEELAEELSVPIKVFLPDLPRKGSSRWEFTKAYYTRNKLIAEYCDELIAVVASDRKGGTENTIKYFLKCNKRKNLTVL